MNSSDPILEVDNLTIQYRTDRGNITAVSNASFTIEEGQFFGLVGESGCGKSTMARAIIGGLDPNGHIESGEIIYRGKALHNMSEKELNKEIRWNEISFIPQGSMSSLDPLFKIQEQAVTIAKAHGRRNEKEVIKRLRTLFEVVGLPPERVSDYPHEFSGGMQQRAIIALAFLLEPNLIIADEPTTALDVIMEDQVFKYLSEIKESTATSMVLITHDISLVFESCERMAIMHGGQIAESGPTTDVFDNPVHPYSILLQQSFPDVRYPDRELVSIKGEPPEVIGLPDYCTFEDRCPLAVDECRNAEPHLDPIDDKGHQAACFRKDDESAIHELRNQRMATQEGHHE